MRKRRRFLLLLAVALLAVACAIVLLASLSIASREPSFKGKRLAEWARMFALVNSFDGRNQAIDAFFRIGTNAIPYLLKWIRYEPPAWKARLHSAVNPVLGKLNSAWVLRDKENARAVGALEAFKTLGPQAVEALDDLRRVINDPKAHRSAERATEALSYLGVKAFPALSAALTNSQTTVRLAALEGIRYLTFKAGGVGTNAALAVPGLVQCLQLKDEMLAAYALAALIELKLTPDLAVPILTGCLNDSRRHFPSLAAQALADFGEKARPAVPVLLNLLTNPDFSVRANATNALRKIDSQALENATRR